MSSQSRTTTPHPYKAQSSPKIQEWIPTPQLKQNKEYISHFTKASTHFQNLAFQHQTFFFFLFSKLNCRYLWNIHWKIMDFIHPRFFSFAWFMLLSFNQTWVLWVVQPWPGPWGSEWVEESSWERPRKWRKVRMILAWFGERKSGGAVERGRNELWA